MNHKYIQSGIEAITGRKSEGLPQGAIPIRFARLMECARCRSAYEFVPTTNAGMLIANLCPECLAQERKRLAAMARPARRAVWRRFSRILKWFIE